MRSTKAPREGATKACRECGHWKSVKERVRLMELLESAIDKMQAALEADGFKPTIGDYAKLVQMEKDLDEAADEGKEIRVRWIEPTDSPSEE